MQKFMVRVAAMHVDRRRGYTHVCDVYSDTIQPCKEEEMLRINGCMHFTGMPSRLCSYLFKMRVDTTPECQDSCT